jgi:hypothetical protein
LPIPTWSVGQVLAAADVNTWFVPRFVYKTGSTSRASNTTATADPDLALPVDANAVYDLEVLLHFDGASGGDMKTQWSGPASMGLTGVWSALGLSATTSANDQVAAPANTSPWQVSIGAVGAGTAVGATFRATVTTSVTAGTLSLLWAQSVSNGTATILHAGSSLRLDRVG